MVLTVSVAWAWETTGYAWDVERFPLAWCSEGESEWVSAEELESVVQFAADAWTGLDACTPVDFVHVDSCDDADLVVQIDDAGLMDDDVALVQSYSFEGSEEVVLDQSVVTISAEWEWLALDENCVDRFYLGSTLVHTWGHALGLGHSCEQEEICLDSVKLEAAMYWTGNPCHVVVPNQDDIDGLLSLYPGTRHDLTWEVTEEGEDAYCFTVSADPPMDLDVTWSFDGVASAEWSPCHQFEGEGEHTARVVVTDAETDCVVGGEETSWSFWTDLTSAAGADTEPTGGCACGTRGRPPIGLLLVLGLVPVVGRRRELQRA